jgi:hypothetical protein
VAPWETRNRRPARRRNPNIPARHTRRVSCVAFVSTCRPDQDPDLRRGFHLVGRASACDLQHGSWQAMGKGCMQKRSTGCSDVRVTPTTSCDGHNVHCFASRSSCIEPDLNKRGFGKRRRSPSVLEIVFFFFFASSWCSCLLMSYASTCESTGYRACGLRNGSSVNTSMFWFASPLLKRGRSLPGLTSDRRSF